MIKSNKIIDRENPHLRLRKIYLLDLNKTNFEGHDFNEFEKKEIERRKNLIEYIMKPDEFKEMLLAFTK